MRFNKLRLTGFKSFVDSTELIIRPGLTGVVGPNGCGKSNLLEALRWIMGENRPTAMRGSGMEDVIFAGSDARPARHYAEVALQIDNSDRTAPAEFNNSDILDIIRRITRDAGSAYRVNGKEARARDVQMLFADASTGSHSPALVRQGQISELINAKPKARRRVLEEAAGISGLYQRRHEAELRLNSTETNLARVEDVVEQFEVQLGTLARQARQAARYREISKALRRAEALLLFARWHQAELDFKNLQIKLTEASKETADAQIAVNKATKELEHAEAALPSLREEEVIASALFQRLSVERDNLRAGEAQIKQNISSLESRLEQIRKDNDREKLLQKDADETIKKLEWEKAALEKAHIGFEERFEEAQISADNAAKELSKIEHELSEHTETMARLSAQYQAAEKRLTETKNALERANSLLSKAHHEEQENRLRIEKAQSALEIVQIEAEKSLKRLEDAETGLTNSENARADAQTRELRLHAEISVFDGEIKSLSSEKAALDKALQRNANNTNPLIDKITVQAGYEHALGAALGDDLNFSQSPEALKTGWAEVNLGGHDHSLLDQTEALAKYVDVPKILDRRIAHIAIVDKDKAPALQKQLKPGQRLVTLEGDLWRWDGLVVRSGEASSSAAIRLEQINRLKVVNAELENIQGKRKAIESELNQAKSNLQTITDSEKKARKERQDAEHERNSTLRELSRAETELEVSQAHLESLALHTERNKKAVDDLTSELETAKSNIQSSDALSKARDTVDSLRLHINDAREKMITTRSLVDQIKREGNERVKRLQEITQEISGWKHRASTADARISDLISREESIAKDLKEAQQKPQNLVSQLEELAVKIEDAEQRKKRASDALAIGENTFRGANSALKTAEHTASEAREKRARIDAMGEAAQNKLEDARNRIEQELETEPENILNQYEVDLTEIPNSNQLEMDVARLSRQREGLGAVNLRAEEDSVEVSKELETLKSEKDDLEEAIKKLRSGISNLNKEGRERLLKAFEEVNKNFRHLFTTLFGGGEANLVLVESDDPLEAGLEIMCQPPGKKLSTLSLLSGGEQTLTALSLIFAVFLANPSPICVLDEVDAPLDDANVARFCNLLDRMTKETETRFMIITHHALTMSRMDRLFGVTMTERGVSQLVSVDLSQAEKFVA